MKPDHPQNYLALSQADVQSLLSDSSVESRVKTAEKIAIQFKKGSFSDEERTLAEDIFRILIKDVEIKVRKTLCEQLKNSPDIPHDVALSLAREVDEIALPFLQSSHILTDEDLLTILEIAGEAKQIAIARRDTVSQTVSGVLADIGTPQVLETLIKNQKADISQDSLNIIIDRHGQNERLQKALANRDSLPVNTIERLIVIVSEALRDKIIKKHHVCAQVVERLTKRGQEAITLNLITPHSNEEDIEFLIDSLFQNQRLTPTIILRALCSGNIAFFEHALARLSGVPLINARILIHDKGDLGLKALYEKTGLPEAMFDVFRIAIEVFDKIEMDGGDHDAKRFSRRMLERLTITYSETNILDPEDMNFLLNQLDHIEMTGAY